METEDELSINIDWRNVILVDSSGTISLDWSDKTIDEEKIKRDKIFQKRKKICKKLLEENEEDELEWNFKYY